MWALCDVIFGCHHHAISWPRTVHKPGKRTYVVCLSCGAEFDYDFETMQIQASTTQSQATTEHEYAI
jgi:hypothetical protein